MSALLSPHLTLANPATKSRREWLSVASHLDPKYGGIATMLPQLCSALERDSEDKAQLLGVCSHSEAAHVPPASRGSIDTVESSEFAWLLDSEWQRTFETRLAGADVVHIHGLWEKHCVSAARAARKIGKPYVISAHGMLERWALRNKRLKKIPYAHFIEKPNVQGAACLHALTLAEAEDYRRFGAANPIAIIPNGVSVPSGVSGGAFLEQFPQLRGERLVLYLGRIHYKKGLDLLVRSWRQIAHLIPDAHLVLAGPDCENTRAKVERAVEVLGIQDRVTFSGMLAGDLKWSALAASELFVLPSYSEGFSMSVLEALGMQKPVVITRQCNVPEVSQNDCGWIIEPDIADLTNALLDALNMTPRRRREMGANGKALVDQSFSWNSVGERMRAVYEWVLGGPQPPDVLVSR